MFSATNSKVRFRTPLSEDRLDQAFPTAILQMLSTTVTLKFDSNLSQEHRSQSLLQLVAIAVPVSGYRRHYETLRSPLTLYLIRWSHFHYCLPALAPSSHPAQTSGGPFGGSMEDFSTPSLYKTVRSTAERRLSFPRPHPQCLLLRDNSFDVLIVIASSCLSTRSSDLSVKSFTLARYQNLLQMAIANPIASLIQSSILKSGAGSPETTTARERVKVTKKSWLTLFGE